MKKKSGLTVAMLREAKKILDNAPPNPLFRCDECDNGIYYDELFYINHDFIRICEECYMNKED